MTGGNGLLDSKIADNKAKSPTDKDTRYPLMVFHLIEEFKEEYDGSEAVNPTSRSGWL
ncbi:MAG: hypothetical protein GJU77_00750 [Ferrovum sp.]|jgi:hypothetical protein|nr:hypothetical protein [Ferrovum sp.]NDU89654.1 hypothetical protein [Ferrovum sp.]